MDQEKRRVGRPSAEIDQAVLEQLAERQWTESEIAAFFKVDRSTINRKFNTVIQECRERGCAKLRDLQWARALKGDAKILVHMSKHYLKQHDRHLVEAKTHNVMSTPDQEQAIKAIVTEVQNMITDGVSDWSKSKQ